MMLSGAPIGATSLKDNTNTVVPGYNALGYNAVPGYNAVFWANFFPPKVKFNQNLVANFDNYLEFYDAVLPLNNLNCPINCS